MPYTMEKPPLPETAEQLRARIPGWGADLDPADRPSVPMLLPPERRAGAHWDLPDRQPGAEQRERSIEHASVTPAFGTTCPPSGLSGAIRRYSYRRFSEGRAAHWLLLLGADRVDAVESHLRSFATSRPDNPITQTGVRSELSHGGLSSRLGQNRTDIRHQAVDPVIVAGPWVAAGVGGVVAARAAIRALSSRR